MIEVSYEEESLNHNAKFITETSAEHSISPDFPSTDGIYGEPSVLPRLGYQYQVEIPSQLSETERLQLQNTPVDNADNIDFNFYTGKELAIPIIWVHHVADHIGHVQELGTTIGSDTIRSWATIDSRVDSKCSTVSELSIDNLNNRHTLARDAACKVEISGDQLEHVTQITRLANLEYGATDNLRNNVGMPLLQSRKTGGYIPLPGSAKAPWSDSESQSFLLGLYIFGKNLVQVQRFVESKDMGDVLSFYYGKFYRSDAQRRWVECRKIRSRRCILGHRIFTGWRQQELLSRLLPSRAKEVRDTLLEVTKALNEGSVSLEEFIYSLKAIVGKETLVEAIGIGKGKQDLTGIILDPIRTNPVVPARPEIPVGKACSSLTSGEIIKFLTGDFRLSKAKSNDLFWEAVWPRLLARGWHSEQPKDISSLGSRNTLVFLIPGIKKFSRRKLTKGNHYFDSVSDVLNRVASDPRLLELEAEESSRAHDESQWNVETADTKVVQNGPSVHHRPCYLRPRLPDCNSDLMKFTVVDTSLVQGGTLSKVRELRSLPADVTSSYRPNHQGVTNSDSSTEQSTSGDSSLGSHSESYQSPSDDKKVRNKRNSTSIKTAQSSLSDLDPKLSLPGNGNDLEGHCCELLIDKPPIKDTEYQFSPRVKPGEHNALAPAIKRQKLISCKSTAADNRICREEDNGDVSSHEKSQPRTLIDLNVHPQDFDSEGSADMEVESSQDDLKSKGPLEAKPQLDDHSQASETNIVSPDGQLPTNGRRQSTRNRPPTAKALEALACGFLGVKKEKGTKTSRSGNLASRSSRRVRKNNEASLPAPDTNLMAPDPCTLYEELYHRTTNQASLFDNSHARTERKETHELLGVL